MKIPPFLQVIKINDENIECLKTLLKRNISTKIYREYESILKIINFFEERNYLTFVLENILIEHTLKLFRKEYHNFY